MPRQHFFSFLSFLSRKGGGGRSIFYFIFILVFFYNVFAVTHQSRIYVCSFCSATANANANANETGIEETRGSREHVRPGDHHGLDGIWFVPDHGRLHGGVRVRRAGWVLASLAGPLLFSTAGQVASVSAGVAGMLGIGGDIPAYLHSLIFLVAAASLWQYTTAGAGIGVGDQRRRCVSLRAYGDYVEQLRRGYVESSVLAYGCGQENRIGRTRFGHGDVAVVAKSDGVCQF